MSVYHDEVEIEDFEYDEETEMYHYPCPCGDRFEISKVRRLFFVMLCRRSASFFVFYSVVFAHNNKS